MAWTNWGFDGTINEAQWAQMAGLLGNDYVAAGNGDCLVTAVPGARSVSVAAGTLYGDGVVSVNSGAETVAMTTPVNGQWYVIALRRTWASNTAALVAIAGATTSTTTPTAPPTSFPTLNTDKGVLTDQPIAWAWCNSANTTVVVYDIRMRAVKSLPPVVANATERDAKFMNPTQGLQVWRNDLGAVETYYGLYNASTNPGGRDTAGWDTDTRAMGLVPIKPSTVTAVSGTVLAYSLGRLRVQNCSKVIFSNIFSTRYANYRIIYADLIGSSSTTLLSRYSTAGTENSSSYYEALGNIYATAGFTNGSGQNISLFQTGLIHTANAWGNGFVEISNPGSVSPTTHKTVHSGYDSSSQTRAVFGGGFHNVTAAVDGISFIANTGTFSGTFMIYGYND